MVLHPASTYHFGITLARLHFYVKRCTTTAFCSLACSTVSESGNSREGNVVWSTNGRGSGRELDVS